MSLLWDALAFVWWFAIAFGALAWIASRMYSPAEMERLGGKLAIVGVLIALWTAYAMVSHPPQQTECVETGPTGSGRC